MEPHYNKARIHQDRQTTLTTIKQEFNKNAKLHSTCVSVPLRPEQ